MLQDFEALLHRVLRAAAAKGHPLLHIPGARPVMAVLEALPEFIRSRPLTVSQADVLAERAAELLLVQEPRMTEFDLLEALLTIARNCEQWLVPRRDDQFAFLVLVKVAHGLGTRAALAPAALAAILLEASLLDARLAALTDTTALQNYYGLRGLLLPALVEAFSTIPGQVRHTDLVVRFRLALYTARSERMFVSGLGGTSLRELTEDIEKRAQEAREGQEMNSCAARVFRVGEHVVSEAYRSLPLLRAEALLARGQVSREHRLGTFRLNLEDAFLSFDTAFAAFIELEMRAHAACAAIAATECLDQLVSLRDTGEDVTRALLDLRAYGESRQEWLNGASLPEGDWLSHVRLLRTAYGRGLFHAQILELNRQVSPDAKPVAPGGRLGKLYHGNIETTRSYLDSLLQLASSEPWQALALGRAACVLCRDLLVVFLTRVRERAGAETFERVNESQRELCRDLLSEPVRDAFFEAFEKSVSRRWSVKRLREESPERIDGRHPLESPHRAHEAVSSFIWLLAWSGQPLTSAQAKKLGTALARARVPALPITTLLSLSRDEPEVLALTARAEVPLEDVLEYVEQRIHTLNEALSSAGLSAPERLLLSGWVSALVQRLREATGDLDEVEPARALALIDLAGASAFRAELFLFGGGESSPPPAYTTARPGDMHAAVRRSEMQRFDGSALTPEWLFLHLSRDRSDLDYWSRMKMLREAGRERPEVRELFAPLIENGGVHLLALPSDMSAESISQLTRVPPEQWEHGEGTILIRQATATMTPEEINERVDLARERVSWAFFELAARGLIPDGEPAPLASARRIEDFLAAHPALAIVVTGFNQEGAVPISLFFHAEGQTQRHLLGAPQLLTGDEPEFLSMQALISAFMDPDQAPGETGWYRLGEAIEKMCTVHEGWARQLGEHLERHGLTQILFMLRGTHHVLLPWEELHGGPGGLRLGERYTIGYVHTLAELPAPEPVSGRRRQGTLQLYGGGVSWAQMEWARRCQQSLADRGLGRPPLSGEAACDAAMLHQELRGASRVRLFLHGHHDRLNPESDRITLVDAEQQEDRVDLHPSELRRLPLAGVECVELWACEGAAHGRELAEHGLVEEPEDLSAAFLLAGSRRVLASRWRVPALSSALMMERFALLVGEGWAEAAALARTREECRAAFAPGGLVERALRGSIASEPWEETRSEGELRASLDRAFTEALMHLRTGWGASRDNDSSGPELSRAMSCLVRYTPPRSASPAVRESGGSTKDVNALIVEYLQPLQNPMCWAGWRLILRGLEDWRG